MRASKFKKYIIVTLSILGTLGNSLSVLFWALVSQGSKLRTRVDKLNQIWSQMMLNVAGIKFELVNANKINFTAKRSYIIMSNHASLYDIPLIIRSFPKSSIRMITKKELFRVPIWGQALKAAEYITIDRQNREQAQKDIKVARAKMESGIVVWIAPEGTRTRSGKMNPFKKGGFLLALQTNAIIIPVGIRGSGKILPPDTTEFNLGEKVSIHIGDPIATEGYSVRQMRELMAKVEGEIKQLAGE